MISGQPTQPLSPLRTLAGKHVLLIGTTGFLAKVMLSMLVERYSVGRLYCLIRAQRSKSARQRFWDEVMGSEMMEPLQARLGPSFQTFVDEKVEVLAGDISQPNLGQDEATVERLRRDVDVVINSAGLVTFNPPFDDAIEVNTIGALEVAKLVATFRSPKLVHISTCFVAGNRSGLIREDEPIVGSFPKQKDMDGVTLDWAREIRDVQRLVEQIKSRTDDAALESRFRQEALDRLEEEGRDVQERTLRAAITNQRRRWLAEELIRVGIERAQHWGWPNIYTYSKALGEQALAATEGLDWAIVRPAIVESSLEYPFPGWNEGMNTSAPLAYLGTRGHVSFPAGDDLILDVVPVDHVASATLAATAALLEGERSMVYQVAAGDVNPASMARVVTLVGLKRRREIKRDEASGEIDWLTARLRERRMPLPVAASRYDRTSAPAFKSLVQRARKFLDDKEPARYGPLAGVLSQARKAAREAETEIGKVVDVFDLFMPFIVENRYVFRTAQTRRLFARMDEADRALLPYTVETMDWRHYWLEVHLPGLEKWVFPKMDTGLGPKRIQIPRSYRDVAEMFESRTDEHARRTAFRVLRKDDVADSYSYRDVRRAAEAVADALLARGVKPGERVLLVSESRPEWGMSYFGILLAGATAVPIDVELSPAEIANLARAAEARGIVASDKQRERLAEVELPAPVWSFASVFERADAPARALVKRPRRKPEDVASILFTSGTTGRPKGVMLTDRNFTALTARLSALFDLNRTDSLLSVLPLHHTFEFSAGLLMPFSAGASITYLEERTPELLSRAFKETPVTAMIGVPAVWEALHRKIFNQVDELGRPVAGIIRALMRVNAWLRDKTPWNVGRWVFRPMHDALGGRMRLLVSGGAPLKSEIWKDFRGLGFSLYEGYGMTEAAPVITVSWPRMKATAGSVGWALPGLEVRIADPDDAGVGEVIARGPTIMAGYLDDPESTERTVRDGWLRTGDQGKLDDEGRLYIVGRQKDVIIDTGGKNVYPDEVEALYAGCPFVKELCVVGIPAETGTGERVACCVVPAYEAPEAEAEGLGRDQVHERIREHFRDVGAKQPVARRVKVLHHWDEELPKTSTRKIKRPYVRELLVRLERTRKEGRHVAERDGVDRTTRWVERAVSTIAQRAASDVVPEARLSADLGFDSLMQLELLNAVEDAFPHARITQEEMAAVETVADLLRLAARDRSEEPEQTVEVGDGEDAPIKVPAVVAGFGKAVLGLAQRAAYERLFEVEVFGRGNIPANRNFIVAANHASHLDMGLVKFALQGLAGNVSTLAAKDYFFDDPLRRLYFENFTNLLPMDRHGSLKKSLRLASRAVREGRTLLLFPEGTRARDGVMIGFKPAIGYLCLNENVDVLPVYLGGTHEALPVGAALPKKRELYVRIGDPIRADRMLAETKGQPRAVAYRHVTDAVEVAVRRLGEQPPMSEPSEREARARVLRRNGAAARDADASGDLPHDAGANGAVPHDAEPTDGSDEDGRSEATSERAEGAR